MNFQISNHIEEYESYKYECEDKGLFSKYWGKIFSSIQQYIPPYIHPNILTISSLLVMFATYNLGNYFKNSLIFSSGIIYYLLSDGIDGVHARKTKQTSIIGEYLDHVGDTIICGLISDQILNSLGFQDDLIKKNIVLITSLYFTKSHFDSIKTKKIVFSWYEDVSSILLMCSIINIVKPNIFDFTEIIFNFINNCFYGIIEKIISKEFFDFIIFSSPIIIMYASILKNIIKNKINNDYLILNKNDAINSYIYVFYYLFKLVVLTNNIKLFYLIHFIDSYLMFSLINSKIFESQIDYKIIVLMLLFLTINSIIISVITIILTYYFIYYTSKKLNIKII